MAKNNYEFDFQPASWLPSRDIEMLDRVRNIKREDMEKVALENDEVKALIDGMQIVKVIAVPGKLVNIVVK